MEVSLIFKIAAVGILVTILSSRHDPRTGVKTQWAGGACLSDQPCRTDTGTDLDIALYL